VRKSGSSPLRSAHRAGASGGTPPCCGEAIKLADEVSALDCRKGRRSARWYPTVTQMADNRIVITSGYDQSGLPAITQAVELLVLTESAPLCAS
jgi:hypothetical protein